jgi:ribonuclease VapC
LEVGTVLAGRRRSNKSRAIDDLNAFLDEAGITLSPVDVDQARLALQARIAYGRGMGHGGLLNFGDAFSHALAKSLDAPLLFIGDDFGSTDIASAL